MHIYIHTYIYITYQSVVYIYMYINVCVKESECVCMHVRTSALSHTAKLFAKVWFWHALSASSPQRSVA